jgi:hypothetical protein
MRVASPAKIVLLALFSGFLTLSAASAAPAPGTPAPAPDPVAELLTQAPGLRGEILRLALDAAACAGSRGALARPELLTVIDYSLPSTEPRLWVLDLAARKILFQELVAHGKNSGELHSTRFSNELGSLQSSFGLFVTAETYVGKHGYSLRLDGLEPGVNDLARQRAIVMHGASYVSEATARVLGRLGRSWGCPAVRSDVAESIIDAIQGGSAVFSYYPDSGWLAGSQYLTGCSTEGTAGSWVARAAAP